MRFSLPFIHPERWRRSAQLVYAFVGPALLVTLSLGLTSSSPRWARHLFGGIGAGIGCAAAVAWTTRTRRDS